MDTLVFLWLSVASTAGPLLNLSVCRFSAYLLFVIYQAAAAAVILSLIRAYLDKTTYQSQRRSAVLLASAWRGFTNRRRYRLVLSAIVIIQQSWRQYILRVELAERARAAENVQRAIRGFLARQRCHQLRADAIAALMASPFGMWLSKVCSIKRYLPA